MKVRIWSVVCIVLILSGCAARLMHQEGMDMIQAGKVEEGLSKLGKAVEINPGDVGFRKDYYLAQMNIKSQWLAAAQKQILLGDVVGAEVNFNRVLHIDSTNVQANEGLLKLRRNREYDDIIVTAKRALTSGDGEQALALLRPILTEDPKYPAARALKREIEEPLFRTHFQENSLKDTYSKPINLEFRDSKVRMILEVLSRTSGINFILDKDIPADLKTTIFLRNAYLDQVIDLILRTSQLRSKVLNGNTVQIYPDTAEKRKEYQELVVRAFYLQDATAIQMQSTFRTLLRMKDIVIDERLNLITVRDTPEAIRLAEKLVALHDLSEPEVMLEVEVLEVQRDDLLKLGIQWPNQLTLAPLTSGNGVITIEDLKNLNSTRISASFSNPTLNLRQDQSVSNLLANPRIRVHNREKASILIGDKVPVITTTSTATGFVAESVQYLDVGLKLNVEPVIHPSNEVSLRLTMEVSSIASQVSTANGTIAYQIGTRNASTFLRLKDGETQVLAGLISAQDRKSYSGIPGLSKLPVLGRLFSSPSDSHSKTEIVLSITPRIVRNAARAEFQAVEFWSGTENALNTKPLRLSAETVEKNKKTDLAPIQANSATATNVDSNQNPQFIWNGPNQVTVGEQFTLTLRAKLGDSAKALPIQINYDASMLEVTKIIEGDLIRSEGINEKPNFQLDSKKGKFSVDLSRLKAQNASVDGTLVTLKLRALTTGAPTALKIFKASSGASAEIDSVAAPYLLSILP